MKMTESSVFALTTFARHQVTRWGALAVVILALAGGAAAHGGTVVWRMHNAAVYFGLPFSGLEFENPLSGTEMVLSHKVLEWRDADYQAPAGYDDWNVNAAGGTIDGNASEIWMRQQGQSIWTTTTVPSTIVSIHLVGDDNDGKADVLVDGVVVAQVDMNHPQPPETALIIVRGLSHTTHTIEVKDLGTGVGGAAADDVATLGAAALAESDVKWDQPPLRADPENVFYGWNERSLEGQPPIAADDWVCTNNNPVTKIRWWGSFLDWQGQNPPQPIQSFRIRFWTDVPKGADPSFPDFSHPGEPVGPEIYCQNYTSQFVGWDFDPRSRRYEACFLYEQALLPHEWFHQQPGNGTNIYWISIEAGLQYPTNVWGWKTRPRDPDSAAPDDAVVFDPYAPPPGMYMPLWWPDPEHSWDLAFELITASEVTTAKWWQVPDLTPEGMDVHASWNPNAPLPYLLADDFLCTSPGPITNITIWGSWTNDFDWQSVVFSLSLHDDIPASESPTGYSMPGALRWQGDFGPGQFIQSVYAAGLEEWWLTPPELGKFPGDHICYQYDFNITQEPFFQEGTPDKPKVYWLDVQARVQEAPPAALFGWKTCPTNWNDDAVWVNAFEPYNGNWNRLTYPPPHRRAGQTVDLAFRLNSSSEFSEAVKWSQRPKPYVPPDGYNGWNQSSVQGQQFVADDWACTNRTPVTDIHWWGSFIGWSMPTLPEQAGPTLPVAFNITFWDDVPAGPQSFSHPGNPVWQIYCTNFTMELAGWDFDPRQPGAAPEACFKWSQDLLPSEWFTQDPQRGTNIYWVSIAAVYAAGQEIIHPWGWKTRLRDPSSLAPDDAVVSEPGVFPPWRPIEYPAGTSWDMAFVLTTAEGLIPTNDFSDAPRPYPTLLANDGARHQVVPGVFLGNAIDAELDGQPNATATGDDNNPPAGPDDEDGVGPVWGIGLVPGELATVTVTASVPGFLSAWVDFNVDGSWAEAGDQIFTNITLNPGPNNLSFNVPFASARGTNTFARFRFSTAAITNYTGWAADGEVEDYQWYLEELDFGDAPQPTFPTQYATDGARHVLAPTLFLGQLIDTEFDGQPNAAATGDDLANLPDEDGVALITPLLPGQPAIVQVTATMLGGLLSAPLNAWIDFGADGSWAETGDQICTNAMMIPGVNFVNFNVPPTAAAGSKVFVRFRFSTMGSPALTFRGIAPNGEVEDYQWHIDELDFGDAPDPTFPTRLINNGARHVIGPLFLGATVDAESDGQPDVYAAGDDKNPPPPGGTNDEDGVFIPTALIAGAPATLQVVSSGAGFLQGWFDFDGDGTWTNANEQPIVNRAIVAGTNTIQIFMPNTVAAGRSYARFRLSTVRGLSYTNQAPDGEVEDYAINFQSLKWIQPPEQGPEGVDVRDDIPLADDYLCRQSGPITDIHFWGSFLNDVLPVGGPGNMNFTLTIYSDVPLGPGGYSQPGSALWTASFGPNQFTAGLCMVEASEWWHDPLTQPPLDWIRNADTNIWQFDFYINADKAFQQVSNTVYWLGVKYTPVPDNTNYSFGWKTTVQPWNDAACWFDAAGGKWLRLLYGDGHPRADDQPPWNQMDLAFALSTEDLDWGDAPDPTYPTLGANNGARHIIVPGLMLGNVIDKEPDGQPNANATGDDLNPPAGLNDEDGIWLPILIPGQPATLQATVTGSGLLNGWIDFGADGSWNQPGDQILTNVPVASGTVTLPFLVPSNAVWGATAFARFRLSTMSNLAYTGLASDGEVEDYAPSIHPLPQSDLGDAPDSSNNTGVNMTAYPKGGGGPPGILAYYPTVYGGPVAIPPFGPIHLNAQVLAFLGNAYSGELEADIGPDQDFVNNLLPVADVPDQDSVDDGLIGRPILPHCGVGAINVQVSVVAPAPGPLFLNVWCDWNRDGDWNDILTCPDGTQAAEWAVPDLPVFVPGPGVYTFPVPLKAWHPSLQKQPLWMRLTLAEQQWLTPGSGTGAAAGDGPQAGYRVGETEDYYLTDYDEAQTFDFGDAPSPYPTALPSGARHLIVPNFLLGINIDNEANGLPDPLAMGDDLNNTDDEDGVRFVTPMLTATQACVDVFLTGAAGGKLDAWLDFNRNGIWDAAEQIFTTQGLVNGWNLGLCFNVPTNAVLGTNFVRFRLSSLGGLSPAGAAQEGEVEDYQVVLRQRAPLANIVITNMLVTNLVVGGNVSNVVLLQWNAQTDVQYQVQAVNTFSNAPPLLWSNVGPVFLGPANTHVETNAVRLERYYRVLAPHTWP